jgi:hypothetical protein
LGRYKGVENTSNSRLNKEVYYSLLKFHFQPSITEVCQVFDESPTPELRDFSHFNNLEYFMIQVDIGGHPPFPTGSKQFSGNFGNLLFLAVFSGPKLPGPF